MSVSTSILSIISSDVQNAMAVGAGAVCGALCRHNIGQYASAQVAAHPKALSKVAGFHTAGINIGGSFLLGMVFATPATDAPPPISVEEESTTKNASILLALHLWPSTSTATTTMHSLSPRLALFLGVGFCGAFTTFSSYAVDTMNMIHRGEITKALMYVFVNNIGGMLAAAAGMVLVRTVLKL